MSYTSGMAIGLAIGQQLLTAFSNHKENGSKQNSADILNNVNFQKYTVTEQVEIQVVKLASALKGRRRYYVEVLKNNPKLAKLLTLKLSQIPYISSVTTNINTGSLLITYSAAEEKIDELIDFLKERIFKVTRTVKRLATEGLTSIEAALVGMVHDVDKWIKLKTGNLLDLNTTFAFFFIIRGIRKILNMGERPSGPMMLWWGYSLVKGVLSKFE